MICLMDCLIGLSGRWTNLMMIRLIILDWKIHILMLRKLEGNATCGIMPLLHDGVSDGILTVQLRTSFLIN